MNFARLPIASALRYRYRYEEAQEYYLYLLSIYNNDSPPLPDPRPKLSNGVILGAVEENKINTELVHRDSRPIVIGAGGWAKACRNDYTIEPIWESIMAYGRMHAPVKLPRSIIFNVGKIWTSTLIEYIFNDNDLMQFLNRCGISMYSDITAPIINYGFIGGGNPTKIFGFRELTDYKYHELFGCPGGKILFLCDGERFKDTIQAGAYTTSDWIGPVVISDGPEGAGHCEMRPFHDGEEPDDIDPGGNRNFDEFSEGTTTDTSTISNPTYADCDGGPVIITTVTTAMYVSATLMRSNLDVFIDYNNRIYKNICEKSNICILNGPENFRDDYNVDKIISIDQSYNQVINYIRQFFAEDENKL